VLGRSRWANDNIEVLGSAGKVPLLKWAIMECNSRDLRPSGSTAREPRGPRQASVATTNRPKSPQYAVSCCTACSTIAPFGGHRRCVTAGSCPSSRSYRSRRLQPSRTTNPEAAKILEVFRMLGSWNRSSRRQLTDPLHRVQFRCVDATNISARKEGPLPLGQADVHIFRAGLAQLPIVRRLRAEQASARRRSPAG
jgi:hypothetical protein